MEKARACGPFFRDGRRCDLRAAARADYRARRSRFRHHRIARERVGSGASVARSTSRRLRATNASASASASAAVNRPPVKKGTPNAQTSSSDIAASLFGSSFQAIAFSRRTCRIGIISPASGVGIRLESGFGSEGRKTFSSASRKALSKSMSHSVIRQTICSCASLSCFRASSSSATGRVSQRRGRQATAASFLPNDCSLVPSRQSDGQGRPGAHRGHRNRPHSSGRVTRA